MTPTIELLNGNVRECELKEYLRLLKKSRRVVRTFPEVLQ